MSAMKNGFPYPCLLADVGGTNARFAYLETPDAPVSTTVRLPTNEHRDFTDTVRAALKRGAFPKPRSFLLAAAGAIEGKGLTLSNATIMGGPLKVDGPTLRDELQLEQGILLNDFEALSLSLPFIPKTGLMAVGGKTVKDETPQIVVGAGTGLGVGALLNHNGRYIPLASEGGHTAMGPESADDIALWPLLGSGRISGDDLLSGRGLTRLYRALGQLLGVDLLDDAPSAISARALSGTEPLAEKTVDRFLLLLGRFAGDMAITFGARSGVFIGGGIAPRLASIIPASLFREAFEAKEMHHAIMTTIPAWLIIAPDPALIGLAQLALTPEKFSLDYKGRFWR
jgi:glucokinase